MPLPVADLETILQKQKSLYCEILEHEERKGEAIISKNGKVIQEISSSQEKLLKSVDALETERMNLVKKNFAGDRSAGKSEIKTLREIAASIDSRKGASIIKQGEELKSLLLKVRAKQENNSSMLKDNMEYFDILISGLKNSSSMKSGYDRDGKEDERVINPVLFNQKA